MAFTQVAPLTLEELEARLKSLEARNENLKRAPRRDQRIPLLATEFDLEDAIFPPAVRVYRDSNQTIPTATNASLSFNQERFDTDTMHDTSTNPTRLTATTAGIYAISGNLRWAANATGKRLLNVQLDGSTIIAEVQIDPTAGIRSQCISTLYSLSVGQYVRLRVFQNSGGDLVVVSEGNFSPEFSMVRQAPPP